MKLPVSALVVSLLFSAQTFAGPVFNTVEAGIGIAVQAATGIAFQTGDPIRDSGEGNGPKAAPSSEHGFLLSCFGVLLDGNGNGNNTNGGDLNLFGCLLDALQSSR